MSNAAAYAAFGGQAARKLAMVERVQAQQALGRVFPLPYLKWRSDGGMVSIAGALAQTQVPEEFVERTGLPMELVTLCEGLVNSGASFIEDKRAPLGLAMQGGPAILAFAAEWLEAIPVGADLGGVVPRFMHHFLADVVAPGFPMAAHLSPAVRAAAQRILGLWAREISGEAVPPQAWRQVRRDALKAADDLDDPWGLPLSELVESLAWPARGLAPEFVPICQVFLKEFRQFLLLPSLSHEDQDLVTRSLVGLRDLNRAQRDPALSELPFETLLERQPQSKSAVLALMAPQTQARLDAAREQAQPALDQALRPQMDRLLDLIVNSHA